MNSCFSLLCLFANLWSNPSAYAEQVYYNVSPSAAVAVYRAYIEHTYPWTVEEREFFRRVRIDVLIPHSPPCEKPYGWLVDYPGAFWAVCTGLGWGGFSLPKSLTYPQYSLRVVVGYFDKRIWLHEYYHLLHGDWSEEQVEDAARNLVLRSLP